MSWHLSLNEHAGSAGLLAQTVHFCSWHEAAIRSRRREAARIANGTPDGLSAAVCSRDVNRAFAAARRIDTGICHITGPTVHDEAQMPFGGVKDSGYGRFGGKAAINEFTELRWITIQSGKRHYPF